ncbi:ubiquinol-cytochrome c reductase iron-sulfur subunit [Halospeciosus flavus]|uniref:Ubiquinol-cytochrome c reductase iron-sulfur subunit n=1 Tax=Halospeciosus flavus TaxID=3032283 RepID=A0ABD5Z4N0_9EURY|nr:ubiquinol-cytochrome c reductase iron-sulfur subunit [Halospeciosus flavus]
MADEDKYPDTESGRRRFVKGVVGSAALAGVGTAGFAGVSLTTSPSGQGGGPTQYFGIENTDGPAPRGMPQIPIRIDDEGYLVGRYPKVETTTQQGREVKVAREEIAGIVYSPDWFQFCGVQGYEGLDPEYEGDNYFRYAANSGYEWQEQEVSAGDKVHVDDFSNYETWNNGIGTAGAGKPAMVTWRSQDTKNAIPVQVLRSTKVSGLANDDQTNNAWIKESTEQGFVAWLNKCTHFCCVPGFKTTAQAAQFGAANEVYCPCHQSVYDPFKIKKLSFVAYPRPEES